MAIVAPEPIESGIGDWAPLVGRWKSNDNGWLFEVSGEERKEFPRGLNLNGRKLSDGTVSATVRLTRNNDTTGGVFLGYHSPNRPYLVAALGGFNNAYSIFQYTPDMGFVSLAAAGLINNLAPRIDYQLQITWAAQRVRLSVNGVEVLETILNGPLDGRGWGLFGFGAASVSFSKIGVVTQKPKLFIVMPFAEPFSALYQDVIAPVAEPNFDVVRVDEVYGPGIVLDDIRRQIEESHVIVAETSTPNPNVFYELGYAHALKKPAILLARKGDGNNTLPFDVRAYRVIYYDDTIGGKRKVEDLLRRNLEAVLNT